MDFDVYQFSTHMHTKSVHIIFVGEGIVLLSHSRADSLFMCPYQNRNENDIAKKENKRQNQRQMNTIKLKVCVLHQRC